ncbi:hypothetical protein F0562_022788 [Nyssa sinensis]|uniref:Growth-regulating factor n=1 Tax=Nyssa sinensis TaxID=561372 RepID=A0A5J5BG81_9ASTE|nr:hypothetical protein F0562_022788 [Nyssa sinensis]
MSTARNRSPFTASQWQELEHQAVIFKYMVSGVPIPPDLIFGVKKSLEYPLMSSRLFSHPPSFGWGCFEMGFDRKADPEPGRCRRTDGKKWRCSKEAYPDSKYCERHMHRGRNRSRKPVEVITSTQSSPSISSININSTTTTTTTDSTSFSLPTLSSSMSTPETISPKYPYHNTTFHPFLCPLSSSRPPGSCFSPQNNTGHHLLLDSGSYSKAEKDYRYVHGMDERSFFPKASGTIQSLPADSYTPVTMSSSSRYSQLHLKNPTDNSKHQKQQQEQEQHCFVLGTDFNSQKPIKVERGEETQKPFHHFFSEWPRKSRDSNWVDVDQENQSNHASFSATQLSISTPLSTQELFASKSSFHSDG